MNYYKEKKNIVSLTLYECLAIVLALLARSSKSPQCGYFLAESATGAQARVSSVLFFSGTCMYEIEYLYLIRRKRSCCSSIGINEVLCREESL